MEAKKYLLRKNLKKAGKTFIYKLIYSKLTKKKIVSQRINSLKEVNCPNFARNIGFYPIPAPFNPSFVIPCKRNGKVKFRRSN